MKAKLLFIVAALLFACSPAKAADDKEETNTGNILTFGFSPLGFRQLKLKPKPDKGNQHYTYKYNACREYSFGYEYNYSWLTAGIHIDYEQAKFASAKLDGNPFTPSAEPRISGFGLSLLIGWNKRFLHKRMNLSILTGLRGRGLRFSEELKDCFIENGSTLGLELKVRLGYYFSNHFGLFVGGSADWGGAGNDKSNAGSSSAYTLDTGVFIQL